MFVKIDGIFYICTYQQSTAFRKSKMAIYILKL
nr:MAG TPA: hypothetical protein [Caudoviricetes sp.]